MPAVQIALWINETIYSLAFYLILFNIRSDRITDSRHERNTRAAGARLLSLGQVPTSIVGENTQAIQHYASKAGTPRMRAFQSTQHTQLLVLISLFAAHSARRFFNRCCTEFVHRQMRTIEQIGPTP